MPIIATTDLITKLIQINIVSSAVIHNISASDQHRLALRVTSSLTPEGTHMARAVQSCLESLKIARRLKSPALMSAGIH